MLISGETVEANLGLGEIHSLTFAASENDKLFLSFSESVGTGQFNPGIFVYAPDGSLFQSVESTSNGTSFSDLTVPQTGTYTVIVRDLSGDFSGDYSITAVIVDEVVDVDNSVLLIEQTLTSTLDLGDIDTFTFDAVANDRRQLSMTESVGTGQFNPGVYVYAPDSSLIDSVEATLVGVTFDELELPQTGTYTVVVRDLSADFTGDFEIRLSEPA